MEVIEFRAPESVLHHPNTTVELFCHTEGELGWQINGSLVNLNTIDDLKMRGFTFKLLPSTPPQCKQNVTVKVAGNNNTDIRCVAINRNSNGSGDNSTTVTILVAGIKICIT